MGKTTTEAVLVNVETTADTILPSIGALYTDALGRELRVSAVQVGDPLGREVVGRVRKPRASAVMHDDRGSRPVTITPRDEDYSATLDTWNAIWRDKQQPRERKAGDLG